MAEIEKPCICPNCGYPHRPLMDEREYRKAIECLGARLVQFAGMTHIDAIKKAKEVTKRCIKYGYV